MKHKPAKVSNAKFLAMQKRVKALKRQVTIQGGKGIPGRPWTSLSRIRRLRALGYPDREIAFACGCSHTTVWRWRHRLGVHGNLYARKWA